MISEASLAKGFKVSRHILAFMSRVKVCWWYKNKLPRVTLVHIILVQ